MLPNLLYVSDVPVESSYHGSALLYRLLENYPATKLQICETGRDHSQVARRLSNVTYHEIASPKISRLLLTRLQRWVSTTLIAISSKRNLRLETSLNEFQPQAVLAVAHDYGWLSAMAFARRRKIPVHLIIHDDWPNLVPTAPEFRQFAHRCFQRRYQQAASRLCVSPAMEAEYARRYGSPGTVIYPSRHSRLLAFDAPPETTQTEERAFTMGYAGTLSNPGYLEVLRMTADALERIAGRLNIYGPYSAEDAGSLGLKRPNVTLRGLMASDTIVQTLRDECDALVIPMSFFPEDREPMRLNFLSKLTDCTATALPLLIVAPPVTSAVQWVEKHPGVALTVTDKAPELIFDAVQTLATNPELRLSLGRAAARVGNQQFSAEVAQRTLHEQLLAAKCGAGSPSEAS